MDGGFLEETGNSGRLWGGGQRTGAGDGLFTVCLCEHFDVRTKQIDYLFQKLTLQHF